MLNSRESLFPHQSFHSRQNFKSYDAGYSAHDVTTRRSRAKFPVFNQTVERNMRDNKQERQKTRRKLCEAR